MQRRATAVICLVLMAIVSGCASSSLPTLPPSETAASGKPQKPFDTAFIAPGTPTGVYTLVARGILGCWLGADGPLKATHVFQADAASPAQGGAAEIVLHERDVTLRDQRGVRAYRVSLTGEAAGVRVALAALKVEPQLAAVMAKDIEAWAKGGAGCQVRAILPPPPGPVAGKGITSTAAGKKR